MAEKIAAKAAREPTFLLAPFERVALPWLARRLPRWVLPDDLTLLGVLSAIGILVGYLLSNEDVAWLWLANGCLLLHWFGDSLDGTVARVRDIQRPKYGYYLDHLVDGFSMAMVGIGLGLSPFMLLSTGMLVVVLYLLMSINVYLEASTFGHFRIGYGYFGPTEGRVILVLANVLLLLGFTMRFEVFAIAVTALDVVAGIAIAGMAVLLATRASGNLKRLAEEEPAASRR